MIRINVRQAGFSLIELLITVAIIGILAAIAVPSYKNYMLAAGRTEGAGLLMEVMSQQQSAFRNNLSYSVSLVNVGYDSASVESETGLYLVSASACGSEPLTRCIQLTATAKKGQSEDGNLTLNSTGLKTGNWP